MNLPGLLLIMVALRLVAHAQLPAQTAPVAGACAAALGGSQGVICMLARPLLAPGMVGEPWLALAFAASLGLAVISALLVRAIAMRLGAGERGQLLSVAGYALWLPGIIACSALSGECLVTPALLGAILLVLRAGQNWTSRGR